MTRDSLPTVFYKRPGTHNRSTMALALLLIIGMGNRAIAQGGGQIAAPVVGTIEAISIDDPNDVWSGGLIVVGGQTVIIPRNVVLQLPANFLSLQQLFAQAPADCLAHGESGLASIDTCSGGVGGVATILANQTAAGDIIAVDVFIEKGQETISGRVTAINTTDGYFRLNGTPTDPTSGVMVRINDPDSRHTIQQGLGCNGGPNCSADPRFTNDPDNYTFTFSTGYPACIPSTVVGGNRTQGSDANGIGDLLCPDTNRGGNPVADSTKFAPIQLGDSLSADGNFEIINGVKFLSAHTIFIGTGLTTADDPNQPDYMIFDEVEWDVPGFQNERVRALFIGFTTLPTSQLDIFSLHVDPMTNENHEVPLASTRGNPNTVQQGIGPQTGGIFKIRYDVDFIEGVTAGRDPCQNLLNAGYTGACSAFQTMAEEFSILSPITREMIAHTEHAGLLNPGVVTLDINGNEAPNGGYLTPVGLGFPEFVEINLDLVNSPYIASGIPWNLDRRISPAGCVDTDGDGVVDCEPVPQCQDPFPNSGLDPRTQALVPIAAQDRIISFYDAATSTPAGLMLDFPPPDPPEIRPDFGGNGLFANPDISQAHHGDDSSGCYVDVWASSAFTSSMTATFPGEAPIPMTSDGIGGFYAHLDLPPGTPPPTSVTVTDTINNRSSQRAVVDKVTITQSTYDVATQTLTVSATSSSSVGTSSLALGGMFLGADGQMVISGVPVPPSEITITSGLGGSETRQVVAVPNAADLNGDGMVNGLDIQGFVNVLMGN